MSIKLLEQAKRNKADEFYTQLPDIEAEMRHYKEQLRGKLVFGARFDLRDMEADHITPWHMGGKTSPENCQMLCKHDNRRKSGK